MSAAELVLKVRKKQLSAIRSNAMMEMTKTMTVNVRSVVTQTWPLMLPIANKIRQKTAMPWAR